MSIPRGKKVGDRVGHVVNARLAALEISAMVLTKAAR